MSTSPRVDKTPVEDPAEMRRSDPAQRQKVQRAFIGMIVAAVLFWVFGLPALRKWLSVPDDAVYLQRIALLCYALGAILAATAAYAAWYARRVLVSAQFPPPGTWLWRDTRILRGDHARARGWWSAACAVSFLLLAGYAAFGMPAQFRGELNAGSPMQPRVQAPAPRSARPAPAAARPHG